MPTQKEIKATFEVLVEIAKVIRQLKSIPSGHLYAQVMGHLTLDQYEKMISLLQNQKLIRVENHLITWVAE